MGHEETTTLFERAQKGSADALEALYRRCATKLLPIIRLKMGRGLRGEAESRDILQSVLLKSLTRLAQVNDPAAVMAWLARIAEHEIRDRVDYVHRQRRDIMRRLPLEDAALDVPSPLRQALSLAILSEESERLDRAIETLPDAQREAVILRKFEELTFPQMARRLGKSEDACRMMFARGMAALTLQLRGRA
jgi:RNA polymerase sigma-70 factor (ECF subfamily)